MHPFFLDNALWLVKRGKTGVIIGCFVKNSPLLYPLVEVDIFTFSEVKI